MERDILIVDEAHNVESRARSQHSFVLDDRFLASCASEARLLRSSGAGDAVSGLRGRLAALAGSPRRVAVDELPMDAVLANLVGIGRMARRRRSISIHLSRLQQLATTWLKTESSRILSETGVLRVGLMDASGPTVVMATFRSCILMSGTFGDLEAVRNLLGLPQDAILKSYRSPFDKANRPVRIVRNVSTRYVRRNPAMWLDMAQAVVDGIRSQPGSAAVFCPSYDVLDTMATALSSLLPDTPIIVEERGLTQAQRHEVLDTLRSRQGVLLGVMGGSFAEGIDFSGGLLASVHVAGLPAPPPSEELLALAEHYESRFPGHGDRYAFELPAHHKVLQAMGRGIRKETDKCLVQLLDERFARKGFLQALA